MARNTGHQPKSKSDRQPAGRSQAQAFDVGGVLRPWLLAAVCALFVIRPLFPSESAGPRGDGLPMVMLWIVLTVVWLLGAIGRTSLRLRWGWTDVAVGVLILLHSVAAVWGAVQGCPRPALNMLWEWIAYGLSFLLVRQLVVGKKEIRAVLAVMVALAVALASYGLYQYAYEMPATRNEYRKDPNGMLQRAGMWFEENSPERKLFENRLESREPLATFALTNSLAGYLAPWLIVALGIAVGGATRRIGPERPGGKRRLAAAAGFAFGLLLIGACLLLTKSRSAYLAAMLGTLLVGLFCRTKTLRIGWKIPAATVVVVAALVAVGAMVRGLDKEVLSEATKSFGYRLQYWQGAIHLIGDHPWLGCGPGNFQGDYTRYKLPEASEEVADPHNFLLEVWATAGTPAMLALLTLLAVFAWTMVRRCRASLDDAGNSTAMAASQEQTDRPVFALAGLPLGFLLAVPIGLMSEAPPGLAVLFVGLPLAALMIAALYPWVQSGRHPELLPAVGVAVLLVNLLAAGGIGFPGVAGTLWLLLALGLNEVEDRQPWELPKVASVAGLVLAIAIAFACYQTAYRPVLQAQAAMRAAAQDPIQAVPRLAEAAQADPFWVEPWVQLAKVAFEQWQATPSTATLEKFARCTEVTQRLAPNSSTLWLAAGQRYSEVFTKTGQQEAAQKALAYCRRAVELYPNSAISRASLAEALRNSGDEAAFREQATRALELDSLTPHLDKKLDKKLRQRLLRSISPGGSLPSREN